MQSRHDDRVRPLSTPSPRHFHRSTVISRFSRALVRSAPRHPAGGRLLLTALLASGCALPALAREAPAAASAATASETANHSQVLSEQQKAAHALNRLGYGPRPGEIEALAASGVETWMRAQLRPERLNDAEAEAAVARLAGLQLTSAELVAAERRVQQAQRARLAASANGSADENAPSMEGGDQAPAQGRPNAERRRRQAASLPAGVEDRMVVAGALGELQHAKLTRAALSERQLQEVLVDFWFNHFHVDARNPRVLPLVVAHELEAIRPNVFGSFRDLLGAATASPAMLIYLNNAQSSRVIEPREPQRPNRRNREAEQAGEAQPNTPRRRSRGLNENHARELMELHTLGVDGGYTQADVQEVARVLTGWSVEPETGSFTFRNFWHDEGEKRVLGTRFAADGGQNDGERLLDLLATHPATARHLAHKLCQRFVADAPPPALVDRVAKTFLRTKGDLRATYEAIFFSPEFFDAAHAGSKTKSPFEFVVSSVRASDVTINPNPSFRGRLPIRALEANASIGRGGERFARLPQKSLMLHLVGMGQPLYVFGAPTGYPEDSASWVSGGALVARLNYALALAAGDVADASANLPALLGEADPHDANAMIDALAGHLLGGPPSEATRAVLLREGAGQGAGQGAADASEAALPSLPRLHALLLGSPEFQRR